MTEQNFASQCKNKILWERITHYNSNSLDDIHTSWLDCFSQSALIASLATCTRSHRSLSRYMNSERGVITTVDYDFRQKYKRLLLLSGEQLLQVIMLGGTALHATTISKLIDKKRVQQIQTAVGEKNYVFAVKKALFLVSSVPESLIPEPLTITGDDQLSDQIRHAGIQLLMCALYSCSATDIKRLALKLPQAWESMLFSAYEKTFPENTQKIAFAILTRLTREIDPVCVHLFD